MGYIKSDYLGCIYNLERYKVTIKRVFSTLTDLQKSVKFEAIAFRGSSGAAVAYPYSVEFGVPLIHVRKEQNSNCYLRVEGLYFAKSYIILDDFMSSGDTIRTIVEEIRQAYTSCGATVGNKPVVPRLVAIVLYNGGSLSWRKATAESQWLIGQLGKENAKCRMIRCGLH
jgi:adenine/guanine phosphoribosyltransferase-like PRPP-binding protein